MEDVDKLIADIDTALATRGDYHAVARKFFEERPVEEAWLFHNFKSSGHKRIDAIVRVAAKKRTAYSLTACHYRRTK